MDKKAISLLHCCREVLRSFGVELLGEGLIGLGGVDVGVGRAVDDAPDIIGIHDCTDGLEVSDVEECGLLTLHLIDIGEDVSVGRGL